MSRLLAGVDGLSNPATNSDQCPDLCLDLLSLRWRLCSFLSFAPGRLLVFSISVIFLFFRDHFDDEEFHELLSLREIWWEPSWGCGLCWGLELVSFACSNFAFGSSRFLLAMGSFLIGLKHTITVSWIGRGSRGFRALRTLWAPTFFLQCFLIIFLSIRFG